MTTTRRLLPATLTAVGLVVVLLLCLNLSGCLDGLPTGHRYTVAEITDGGTPVPWRTDQPTYLHFEFPKLIRASGGCNEFTGKVDVDHGRLVTREMSSTIKSCDQTLLDQDDWFANLLNSRPKFQLRDDVITLTGDDGHQMKLKKVS